MANFGLQQRVRFLSALLPGSSSKVLPVLVGEAAAAGIEALQQSTEWMHAKKASAAFELAPPFLLAEYVESKRYAIGLCRCAVLSLQSACERLCFLFPFCLAQCGARFVYKRATGDAVKVPIVCFRWPCKLHWW